MSKLNTLHAIAAVLGIQAVLVPNSDKGGSRWKFTTSAGLQMDLGPTQYVSMKQAIDKALIYVDESAQTDVLVWPPTPRDDEYRMIETETLLQEGGTGGTLWGDLEPPKAIDMTMNILRDAAFSIRHPQNYKQHMLRAAVVIVAALQYAKAWQQHQNDVRSKIRGANIVIHSLQGMIPYEAPPDTAGPDVTEGEGPR